MKFSGSSPSTIILVASLSDEEEENDVHGKNEDAGIRTTMKREPVSLFPTLDE